MLLLTRKKNERIVIDNRIQISVCRIRGNRVKIGVEAPSAVSIRRGEVPPETSLAAHRVYEALGTGI